MMLNSPRKPKKYGIGTGESSGMYFCISVAYRP